MGNKWLFSYFVFVEKHVGNAVGDGKFSAGLRADEVPVYDLYLEEDVVGALQELLVLLVALRDDPVTEAG
jgi:hypothetical protein